MLEGVSVDPGCTMLPVSPQISLRVESTPCPRGPWNVAVEHECQNSVHPPLPETHPIVNPVERWWVWMDVVHPRCAGIECSKKDAKVCVRIQGQGRRQASSTVTTWGATTSQILALREHLIAERATCVVIESSGTRHQCRSRSTAWTRRTGPATPEPAPRAVRTPRPAIGAIRVGHRSAAGA